MDVDSVMFLLKYMCYWSRGDEVPSDYSKDRDSFNEVSHVAYAYIGV